MDGAGRLVVPRRVFDTMAGGLTQPEVAVFLRRAARGNVLLLLRQGIRSGTDLEAARTVARLHRTEPESVERVLRYPALGGRARAAARGEHEARAIEMMAVVSAVRGGTDATLTATAGGRGLVLPSLGLARVGGGMCRVVVKGGRAEVCGGNRVVRIPGESERDGAGWRGVRELRLTAPSGREWRVAVDDLDPYRFPVRPERPLEIQEWNRLRRGLGAAWDVLDGRHPEIAAELAATVGMIVPLPLGGPVSGTSRTVFGGVAIAIGLRPVEMAAALTHELQHTKLATLLDLVDLFDPAHGSAEGYYAPWRPDRRPLGGLLHGVYAHLGLAGFWRRERHHEPGGHSRYVRWREAAARTADVIAASGALTPLGDRFLSGVTSTLDRYRRDTVPAHAVVLARQAALAHRRRHC